MSLRRALILACALLAAENPARAYVVLGPVWGTNPVTVYLGLGNSATPLSDGSASFDAVAAGALETWNYYLLRLQFLPSTASPAPFDGDGRNNVFFARTIYGDGFGDAVAVTTSRYVGSYRTEADVIFNSRLSWDSYRGPLRRSGSTTTYDLRRVALHEFGHVVGLDHPDESGQSVAAIMNSFVSDTDELQFDDVRGGQYLYGARINLYNGPIANFDKPRKRKSKTGAAEYFMLGSADPNEVKAVFLRNSRFGRKMFKVKGLVKWRYYMKVKPGRNVVTLWVLDRNGVRQKIDRRIVIGRSR